jgi:hypothetical protein
VISGNLNGDRFPDLAVADLAAGGVRVLLNRGDRSFEPAAFYPTGAGAAAVTAADFTGQGHLDLAVANMLDSTVVVLINQGDGKFTREATYHTRTCLPTFGHGKDAVRLNATVPIKQLGGTR